MSVNPFATVSSYGAMLNRIVILTFGFSLFFTALLRSGVPCVEGLLAAWSIEIPIWGREIPLGTVAPAAIVALLSRIFKLHDRISDVMGIRRRFDVNHILLPLALGSGATIDIGKVKRIRSKRLDLMGPTFYAYASSDPDKTVIDKHKVEMALDMWGWYWVFVEGNAVALATTAVFVMAGNMKWAAAISIVVLISLWILQTIQTSCAKYALDEVAAILEDPKRKAEVAQAFNAL